MRRTAVTAVLSALAIVVASAPDPASTAAALLYVAAVAVAVALTARAVQRVPADARGPWSWLLAAQLLYLVAEALFAVNVVGGAQTPVSAADVAYLLAYLPVAVGLLRLNRQRAGTQYRGSLLDAGILSLSAGTLFGVFVVLPIAADTSATPLVRTVSAAYPICDVLLIFLVARLVTGPGARPSWCWLLIAGVSATIVADTAWDVAQLTSGAVDSPRWVNALWLLNYAFFAVAAASAGRPGHQEGTPPRAGGLTSLRLLVLAVAAVLPASVLVVLSLTDRVVPVTWLAAGSVALVLLVVARVGDLLGQLRAQSDQLERQARTDPLTGLANRRTWDHELRRAFATGDGRALLVAVLDLDHFKDYNDSRGHQAGDELLQRVAGAWTRALAGRGTLARWGGEEFVVALTGHDAGEVLAVLGALRTVVPDGQTCSMGVARWDGREDAAALLARADAALYAAKHAGRDRLVGPDPAPVR